MREVVVYICVNGSSSLTPPHARRKRALVSNVAGLGPVLRCTGGALTNSSSLEEEDERDGGNAKSNEREKEASPIEPKVVEQLSDLGRQRSFKGLGRKGGVGEVLWQCFFSAFKNIFPRMKTKLTQRGTVAPMQERINVLAATADAA